MCSPFCSGRRRQRHSNRRVRGREGEKTGGWGPFSSSFVGGSSLMRRRSCSLPLGLARSLCIHHAYAVCVCDERVYAESDDVIITELYRKCMAGPCYKLRPCLCLKDSAICRILRHYILKCTQEENVKNVWGFSKGMHLWDVVKKPTKCTGLSARVRTSTQKRRCRACVLLAFRSSLDSVSLWHMRGLTAEVRMCALFLLEVLRTL